MRYSTEELTSKTYQYRKRFLEIFTSIGFGHVTSAFSWAEIAAVLYNEIMTLPDSVGEASDCDQIVVSKGHGVGILFPIFEDLGYFTPEQMAEMIRILRLHRAYAAVRTAKGQMDKL